MPVGQSPDTRSPSTMALRLDEHHPHSTDAGTEVKYAAQDSGQVSGRGKTQTNCATRSQPGPARQSWVKIAPGWRDEGETHADLTTWLHDHMLAVLKLLGLETAFRACKLLKISKSFCKCWLQLLTLTTLEIKTKKIPKR